MDKSDHNGTQEPNRLNLDYVLKDMSDNCIECNLCVKQCEFLKEYGTPKSISDKWLSGEKTDPGMAFECSLCSLCTAVCPVNLDLKRLFLEMRRHGVTGSRVDFSRQKLLLNFEKRGVSKRYSFYGLPENCDTILFPGCDLAGSRSERVIQLYRHLQKKYPQLGIVLDCCTKPSHDLGRQDFFQAMFYEMYDFLVQSGIKNILTACPSCYSVFSEYSRGIAVLSVYDILADEIWRPASKVSILEVTVQDSCVARFEDTMQRSVRKLIRYQGINYVEMKHHGKKTLCCGEGGGAHFTAPQLANTWAGIRRHENHSQCIITYCAGCANFLGRIGRTAHLLDLVFDPAAVMKGKVKVARSPITYLKRLLLKRWFRRNQQYAISRERKFIYRDD